MEKTSRRACIELEHCPSTNVGGTLRLLLGALHRQPNQLSNCNASLEMQCSSITLILNNYEKTLRKNKLSQGSNKNLRKRSAILKLCLNLSTQMSLRYTRMTRIFNAFAIFFQKTHTFLSSLNKRSF